MMQPTDFLTHPEVTDAERLIIKWQYGLTGDFETALWEAIIRADEDNLQRLAIGFPDHVAAYGAWAFGRPYSMAEKLRSLGMEM